MLAHVNTARAPNLDEHIEDDPDEKRGTLADRLQPTPSTNTLIGACIVSVFFLLLTARATAVSSTDLFNERTFSQPIVVMNDRLHELRLNLQQVTDNAEAMLAADAKLYGDASPNANSAAEPSVAAKTRRVLKDDVGNLKLLLQSTKSELLKASERRDVPRVLVNTGGNTVVGDPYENETPNEPVDSMPGGPYVSPPDPWAHETLTPELENLKRRNAVVQAFKDSYSAYTMYAWGYDELQPRSKTGKNWNDDPVNSMSLTVLDAITTMHLMGLKDWEDQAVEYLLSQLRFDADTSISAFETTIRVLGSLLSIYELRGEKEPELLAKAEEIARRILWAYNTTTGLPQQTVNLATHHHNNPDWSGGTSVLSEFGTVQLELRTLSYHTKNPIYDMKATHINTIIEARAPKDMLCPVFMSVISGKWMTDHISVGALGDSFYEYLLKQWLLTGKREPRYRDMYATAAASIVDKLVFRSTPSGLAYVAEWKRDDFYHKMDELACFVGGMLAMGAQAFEDVAQRRKMMRVADEVTTTCFEMFNRQKSGIAPEYVEFPGGQDFVNGQGYYLLRPETMESIFYMWRLTKEPKWREMGWKIFAAILRFCKTPESGGFAGIKEVNVKEPIRDNLQQSFWLAETLKYAFLLFSDDSALDLTQWVFNTEAHPLRIRERDPLDVWREYEAQHGHVPWLPPILEGVVPRETEKMRKDRLMRRDLAWRPKQARDEQGEEVDGMPDDDAGAFDPVNGQKGIRRAGITSPAPTVRAPGQPARTVAAPTTPRPRTEAPPVTPSPPNAEAQRNARLAAEMKAQSDADLAQWEKRTKDELHHGRAKG